MKNKTFHIKPQTIFLIIGLIYGLSFVFVTPPLLLVDNEGEHFDKALYLSDGFVIPEISDHHAGYFVGKGAYDLEVKFYTLRNNHEKIHLNDILQLTSQTLNQENKVFTDTDPTPPTPVTAVSFCAIITYSPVPYIASAFAIIMGKIFGLSPIILMYIGRLANLLVLIFLIYMSIKITPVHKWVFLMLALMPMTLLQGASLSADSLTIGLSFLMIAIFIHFCYENEETRINKLDLCGIFVVMLLLGLSKQTYLFLIFLFFLIPSKKFGSKRRMMLLFSLIFLPIFIVSVLWYLAVNVYYIPTYPHVSISDQTSFILSNPLYFFNAMMNTILNFNSLSNITTSFIGNFGWDSGILPEWLIEIYFILYFSLLTLTSIVDHNRIVIKFKEKLIILVTFLFIFVLISASMYITATPLGQDSIRAIAGRYLIPIAPLFFLLFYNNKLKLDIGNGYYIIVIGTIIFSLSLTIYLLIKNFYVI